MPRTLPLSALGLALLLGACASAPRPPSAYVRPYTRIVDATHPGAGAAAAPQARAETWARIAVAQARAGQLDAARRLLERAIDQAPGQAWLYNDLGYLLLLAGDAADAQTALRQALRIDPHYARAAANLHAAQLAGARAPQPAGTAPAVRLAATSAPALATPPAAPALPSANAPVATSTAATATAPATAPATAVTAVTGATVVTVGTAPRAAPPLPSAPAAAIPVGAAPPLRAAAIEVSNGNGVTGMAARVAAELDRAGLPVRRLTNRKPYTQRHSRIVYRAGWRAEALRLRAALPGDVVVEPARVPLRRDIDLRMLLGLDMKPAPRA